MLNIVVYTKNLFFAGQILHFFVRSGSTFRNSNARVCICTFNVGLDSFSGLSTCPKSISLILKCSQGELMQGLFSVKLRLTVDHFHRQLIGPLVFGYELEVVSDIDTKTKLPISLSNSFKFMVSLPAEISSSCVATVAIRINELTTGRSIFTAQVPLGKKSSFELVFCYNNTFFVL